jgi:putative nucleotidyltransferase with HDIG domain
MSFISFKNIKFFKSSASGSKRELRPSQPAAEADKETGRRLWQNPYILILLFGLILSYFISYVPSKSLNEPKIGEIATADIVAPSDVTFEDTETTEKRRRDAEDAVLPVYFFDSNVFANTEQKIRQFFAMGRDWMKSAPPAKDYNELQKTILDKFGIELGPNDIAGLERTGFPADVEDIVIKILEKLSAIGIIQSKSLFVNDEPERGMTLLRMPEGERVIRVGDILEVKEAKDRIVAETNKLELPARKKGQVISLAFGFISPNIAFNKGETEARREKARMAIEKVYYTIKKGKALVRKGDEVTPDALKLIQLINKNLTTKRDWQMVFLGTFLLFALLLLTLWFYLKSLLDERMVLKYFLMMGITLILSLLVYRVSAFLADVSSQGSRIFLFSDAESYRYAFPYQFGAILFAFLTSNTVALIYAILNSLLVGYLFNANFLLMIFSLIGGLAAICGIKFYGREKRTASLRSGFFVVAPLNVFIVIIFGLVKEFTAPLTQTAAEIFMGILGGFLSASLAFVLLPIYESVFGFVTQTKLLELTNSDSPLFRQMAIEAPGSYHHSLIVSALAEKAAEAIGLDPLLVKAGALYHDIGKIKMPDYFIENKLKKKDAHKDLTPSMSTLVIINHVKEGAEIAKKERLPKPIRDIIEQHHGNSLVRYFYQKAKEKTDPDLQKVGEETYRYPGPRPKSKEAALVMLADAAEAASRSLKVHSEENLKRVIKDIFDADLQDGQLDDCNFSLKDLRSIASSFLATLQTVYQPRVEYPGFDFEMKKKKRNGNQEPETPDGRNRQPSKNQPD